MSRCKRCKHRHECLCVLEFSIDGRDASFYSLINVMFAAAVVVDDIAAYAISTDSDLV